MNNLCCKQVKQTKAFQSYRTKETFQIFQNLTCKSENLIYLLQCRICHLQYGGKSKTPFKFRLNNHMEDAKSQPPTLSCKHYNEQNHNFKRHSAFNLIEQIKKQTTAEETITLLKGRENFWLLKLKTSYPDGLIQELNNIKMKLLVLLLHSTALSSNTFSADWNDNQNLGNLISDVKFEI